VDPDPNQVLLRAVRADDLPVFFTHQSDLVAVQMVAFSRWEPGNRAAFDERWRHIQTDPGITARTILLDDRVVGHLVCFPYEGDQEVGYWIARKYWGRGIATRALALFLQDLPMRPLHARVVHDNAGSRRVLEKCGFAQIGLEVAFAEARKQEVAQIVFRLD